MQKDRWDLETNLATRILALTGSAVLMALIGGCGGGGDEAGAGSAATSPPPAPVATAEGNYGGTLTGGSTPHFQALVLENGEFWSIYGQDFTSTFYVYGFVQGSGTSNNGAYTATGVKDFGLYPPPSGTLSATYSATARTISGSITYPSGTVQFSGGPISGSLYDYGAAATLSAIAGHWDLQSLAGEGVSANISASGNVTAVGTSGCQMTGSITPRPSGKNVFDLTLTFGSTACLLSGQTVKGIAISYPLSSGQRQLLAALTDNGRTVGTAVFGIR